MNRSMAMILMAAALMTVSLAGCGRKAAPAAPLDSFYPQDYPQIPFPGGARTNADNDIDVSVDRGAGGAKDDADNEAGRPDSHSLFEPRANNNVGNR